MGIMIGYPLPVFLRLFPDHGWNNLILSKLAKMADSLSCAYRYEINARLTIVVASKTNRMTVFTLHIAVYFEDYNYY
jgi:hypothetical protein